jgi:hypothetical protein
MNKIIWVIVALVILGLGYAVLNNRSNQEPVSAKTTVASKVVVTEGSYDFGTIDIFGGKVETDFMLTNEGTEDIAIIAGTTSCGCTDGSIDGIGFGMHEQMSGPAIIKAGESKNVTAIYDPLAHGPEGTGTVTRQLFLKTNSKTTPEIELRISANVVKNQQ